MSVYSELERLHHQGFETCVYKVHEIAHTYRVRMSGNTVEFKRHCQPQIKEHFINKWHDGLSAHERPFLRTYRLSKSSFGPESHLFNVKDQRYRTAITKLRGSSYILEIERGRYSKPMVPSRLRMGKKCNMVEDEEHFVTKCFININERSQLLAKVRCIFPDIDLSNTRQILVFLVCSVDKQIQKSFGRFFTNSVYFGKNFSFEYVYLCYIQYFISIKIVMHVVRSSISCRIFSVISVNDIGYNNRESVHLLHV